MASTWKIILMVITFIALGAIVEITRENTTKPGTRFVHRSGTSCTEYIILESNDLVKFRVEEWESGVLTSSRIGSRDSFQFIEMHAGHRVNGNGCP